MVDSFPTTATRRQAIEWSSLAIPERIDSNAVEMISNTGMCAVIYRLCMKVGLPSSALILYAGEIRYPLPTLPSIVVGGRKLPLLILHAAAYLLINDEFLFRG